MKVFTSWNCKTVGLWLIPALLAWGCSGNESVVEPAPSPELTSLSPLSGITGSRVIIKGKHLGNAPQVYFGPAQATVNQSSDSVVEVTVPPLANSGPITVVAGSTELNTSPFTVHDVLVLINSGDQVGVWRKGFITAITLPSGPNSGLGLALHGTDIYVSGYNYSDNTGKPTVWKNGVPNIYSTTSGQVEDLAIDGTDVHGFGIEKNGSHFAPAYWLNGNRTFLNTPVGNDNGAVLKLAGGKVYLGGSLATPTGFVAVYWVDQVPVYLTPNAAIEDLAVKNNQVHAVGFESASPHTKAIYWENDTYHAMSDGTQDVDFESLTLDGDDVYLIGSVKDSEGKKVGSLWKNGIREDLEGTYSASKLVIIGSDQLILCYLNDSGRTPAILLNGIPVAVGSPNSIATDMVVREP